MSRGQPHTAQAKKQGQKTVFPYNKKLAFPLEEYPNYNFVARFLGSSGCNVINIRDQLAEKGHKCNVDLGDKLTPQVHVKIGAHSKEALAFAVALVEPFLVPHHVSGDSYLVKHSGTTKTKKSSTSDKTAVPSSSAAAKSDHGGGGATAAHEASPDDWECLGCSNVNWARRNSCNSCGALKPASLPPLIQNGQSDPRSEKKGAAADGDNIEDDLLGLCEVDECPICLELLSKEQACALPCGHEFHVACVESVKKFNGDKQATCPLCQHNAGGGPGMSPKMTGFPAPPPLLPPPPPTSGGNTGGSGAPNGIKFLQFGALDDDEDEEEELEEARGANGGGGGGRGNTTKATTKNGKNNKINTPAPDNANDQDQNQEQYQDHALLELLRSSDGVTKQVVELLVAHGLTNQAALMRAHDHGLSELGMKKGPRLRVLKTVSAMLLAGEDAQVMGLMEKFHLGRYRAFLAQEMIDHEALGLFSEEPDEVLLQDLGILLKDVASFRDAATIARNS